MRLSGKTAVVTGGARGLGAHMCQMFAAEGAQVIAVDLGEMTYSDKGVVNMALRLCEYNEAFFDNNIIHVNPEEKETLPVEQIWKLSQLSFADIFLISSSIRSLLSEIKMISIVAVLIPTYNSMKFTSIYRFELYMIIRRRILRKL